MWHRKKKAGGQIFDLLLKGLFMVASTPHKPVSSVSWPAVDEAITISKIWINPMPSPLDSGWRQEGSPLCAGWTSFHLLSGENWCISLVNLFSSPIFQKCVIIRHKTVQQQLSSPAASSVYFAPLRMSSADSWYKNWGAKNVSYVQL